MAGVGVDMPLHLTDDLWPAAAWPTGRLPPGPRGATLFVTPPASAYEAADYAAGCDVACERTGSASAGRPGAAGEGAGAGGVVARKRPGVGGPPGGVVLAARRRRDPAAEVHVGRPGGPPLVLAGAGIVVPADLGEAAAAPAPTTFSTPPPWPGPPAGSWHCPLVPLSPLVVLAGGRRQAIWAWSGHPGVGNRLVRTVVQTWMLYSP